MEKRKYKKYLYDSNTKMPSSTYYSKYRKKIKNNTTSNETSKINDFDNKINETTFNSETIQKDKELNNQNELVEAIHLEDHNHLEESCCSSSL